MVRESVESVWQERKKSMEERISIIKIQLEKHVRQYAGGNRHHATITALRLLHAKIKIKYQEKVDNVYTLKLKLSRGLDDINLDRSYKLSTRKLL